MDQLPAIDFRLAGAVGAAATPPGPALGSAEIAEVVGQLHEAAARAPDLVSEVSGLHRPARSRTLVVDRSGWVQASARSTAEIFAGLGAPRVATNPVAAMMAKAIGVQVGGVLAALSTRVLGQFEPFGGSPQLLLVAPTVVTVERSLGAVPQHFRLWVCLHEETHRLQFGQAPWLADHLLGLMRELVAAEESLARWAESSARPRRLAEVVTSPQQREILDRVTAVMSVLEGHADVMMDRAGPSVIPTLGQIRRSFEARRDAGGLGMLLSKLIGMDRKIAQYRDGAAFCREVLDHSGLDTLNLVFSEPSAMPSLAELHRPRRWLDRLQS